jgi:hypothetical protein
MTRIGVASEVQAPFAVAIHYFPKPLTSLTTRA